MQKIVCSDYKQVCQMAAEFFEKQLKLKSTSVFGLASGSTPEGLYEELAQRAKLGKVFFKKAKAFSLDEYYPIDPSHPQSYKTYMENKLFNKVMFYDYDILNGLSKDPYAECARYDAAIAEAGGIDLQLLGIGVNGHIGFNEPAAEYSLGSHLVKLSESTIKANSRFFTGGERQPTMALTMGIGTIMNAKSILLLISGAHKADITKKLFDGKIHPDVPACFLLLHPNVTVILDEAAAGK